MFEKIKKFLFKINNKFLIVIELIISIVLCALFIIGDVDEEAGLILNNKIIYLPIILSTTLLLLFALEFIKARPYIRLSILVFSFFICLLMNDSLSVLNASICFFAFIYVIVCVFAILKNKPITFTVSKAELGGKKCLPFNIFSKKELVITYIFFILISISVIGECIFIKGVWLFIFLFITILAIFILFVVLLLKINPFNNALKAINKDLSFEKFINLISAIQNGKDVLHPETDNYLQIIKANYYFVFDSNKGFEIFENTHEPDDKYKSYKDMYCMVKCIYHLNKGDLSSLKDEIKKYEELKNYNRNFVNQIKFIQEIIFGVNEINNIENIFPAQGNRLRFQNCTNAYYLMNYYYKREKLDNAKKYAELIISMKTDFAEYNNYAQKIIDEKNEKI